MVDKGSKAIKDNAYNDEDDAKYSYVVGAHFFSAFSGIGPLAALSKIIAILVTMLCRTSFSSLQEEGTVMNVMKRNTTIQSYIK